MEALNNYLLITPVKEAAHVVGGFEFTDKHTQDIRYMKATVAAVSKAAQGVAEGDTIYYDRHAGHQANINGTLYHVIRLQDIVVVL